MSCTQNSHYPNSDDDEEEEESKIIHDVNDLILTKIPTVLDTEDLVPTQPSIHDTIIDLTVTTSRIPVIRFTPPKCFKQHSGPYWEKLRASYTQIYTAYEMLVYCSCPYTARMVIYTYMGFTKLFSAFCNDLSNDQAIDMFVSTHDEFFKVHKHILDSDIAVISKILRSINDSERSRSGTVHGEKVLFSVPMQEEFAKQIRSIFTLCTFNLDVNTSIDIRVENTTNSLFQRLYDLPLFCDEECSFDILWKYSQKASPIHTYSSVVLEILTRVLKEGFYKVAQCMVLFFVYTLKMVCKLMEYTHKGPKDQGDMKQFHKDLYGRLNTKLIKVFSVFANIVAISSKHTTYEKHLREEQQQRKHSTKDDIPSSSSELSSMYINNIDSAHGRGSTCSIS